MKVSFIRFVITDAIIATRFAAKVGNAGYTTRMVNEGSTRYLDVYVDNRGDATYVMNIHNTVTNR